MIDAVTGATPKSKKAAQASAQLEGSYVLGINTVSYTHLEDIPKLIGFLKRQEANGKFFSKAMQKEPVANTEEV